MLVRQDQPRSNPMIGAKEGADQSRAITFLAAMQQDNVIWQSAGTVKKFADGGKCLVVGKMAMAAGDAALEIQRPGAVELHLGVVVALQRDAVKIVEPIKKVARDVTEVGGIADTVTKAIYYESV